MEFKLGGRISMRHDYGELTVLKLTMLRMMFAVPHGTVLFSTIIAPVFAFLATTAVALSRMLRSAMAPAPMPYNLVGVLTQMKTISASAIDSDTLVENTRFDALAGMLTVPTAGRSMVED